MNRTDTRQQQLVEVLHAISIVSNRLARRLQLLELSADAAAQGKAHDNQATASKPPRLH